MKKIIIIGYLVTLSFPALSEVRETVDSSCNWTTVDSSGHTISTSPTLQDGINFAQANGDSLTVEGNLNCPITQSLTIGPSAFTSYVIRNVALEDATITVDSLYGADFRWSGVIKYSGTANILTFNPTSTALSALQTIPGIQYSDLSFPAMVSDGGSPGVMAYFAPLSGYIINNKIHFKSIDGGCLAARGIFVTNPTPTPPPVPPLISMVQNDISFDLITSFKTHGLLEGSGSVNENTQPLGTNIWHGAINGGCSGAFAAYQTFGIDSQAYFSSISINAGTLLYGVYMGPGATGNYVESPQIQGAVIPGTGNRIQSP